jgi:hypothetical protein
LTDDTSEQSKREFGNLHVLSGTGPRVIEACHTCKYERRDGDERSDFWCEAAGASIDDTLENADWCGPDLNWWDRPASASRVNWRNHQFATRYDRIMPCPLLLH